jgi:hypothetical protein
MVGESNCGMTTGAELMGEFNDHWAAKQIVILDDITKLYKREFAKLKELVTSDMVSVKQKFMDPVRMKSYIVFVVTANERDALEVSPGDRRVLTVSFAPNMHHKSGTPYWNRYVAWLHKDGMSHIKHWLQERDLSAFNPTFQPPETVKRTELMELTVDEDEHFYDSVMATPDEALGCGRSVFTSEELWGFMRDGVPRDLQSFGMKLTKLGFLKANKGNAVLIEGHRKRYYAMRPAARTWASDKIKRDIAEFPLNEQKY